MRVTLVLYNLISATTVKYDDHSALVNMQCPDFFSKAWVSRFSYDLANYDRSSLSHCIPEVTDKKCRKLARIDNTYVADCLVVVWDHAAYNGNLKVTKSRSSPMKCILTYRDRRFQNRLSNKGERFKNECLETTWGAWGEWAEITRKSRPRGQMTQSRRRRCDRSQTKSLPSKLRRLLPRYMMKCEGNKIEFRKVKVPHESSNYSRWGPWSAWSSCSATCGTALSIKTRECKQTKCIGMNQVSRDCRLSTCPVSQEPTTDKSQSSSCGDVIKGCGLGHCYEPVSGQRFCKCQSNAEYDDRGSCIPKPQVLDSDLPKSYAECDEWEFFIDGKPLTDSQCKEHVRQHLANP